MSRLFNAIRNPRKFLCLLLIKFGRIIPDEAYLRLYHRVKTGKKLNLTNPKTYNDKCNWMKLHYKDPLYTQLADKILSKKYVESVLGPGFTCPLIAVYSSVNEIDFSKLPNKFVIKTNHNSGCICICKDKENGIIVQGKSDDQSLLSYDDVKNILNRSLASNFYWNLREWPYKNIQKRILVEEYLEAPNGENLKDYKFFCFHGEPKYVWMGTNYTPMYFDVYSTDWKNQHVAWGYENSPVDVPPPDGYQQMLEMARKLSAGIPHVRVDFFNVDGRIYVGEFTFYTWGGMEPIIPSDWENTLGDFIDIDKIDCNCIIDKKIESFEA